MCVDKHHKFTTSALLPVPGQPTGSTPSHVFPAADASVPPKSTAIPRRLLSPSPHPCSPLRLRRSQVLSAPHLRTSTRLILSSLRIFQPFMYPSHRVCQTRWCRTTRSGRRRRPATPTSRSTCYDDALCVVFCF